MATKEETNRKFYIALIVVFVASILAAILLPVGAIGNTVRELSGVPAVGALCVALYQIARDRIAFERSLVAQELQNSFSIGATSHMAIVAFDRHVAFSEEYVSAMFEILTELFQKGPCPEALHDAARLWDIRKRWSLWITKEVEADLEPFEAALREMGAAACVNERAPDDQGHGERVKLMFRKFVEVMGSKVMGSSEWEGKKLTNDLAIHTIIDKLRLVLGVDELTNLRARLLSRALKNELPGW